MGRRLQHIEEERLQHYHRAESHYLARRRRGRNKEGHCRAGWPSHPCRAFVRGRRGYGSGYRPQGGGADRKSTRLNSSHLGISYAVFCLKKKKKRDDILDQYDGEVDWSV